MAIRTKNCGAAWSLPSPIRVKAPVTRRPPHSSGREDFPHPVPRFWPFLPSHQPIRRHPDGRMTLLPCDIRYCEQFWVTAMDTLLAAFHRSAGSSNCAVSTIGTTLSQHIRTPLQELCSYPELRNTDRSPEVCCTVFHTAAPSTHAYSSCTRPTAFA